MSSVKVGHSFDSRLFGISTSDYSSSEETSSAEKSIRSKTLVRDFEGKGFQTVFGLDTVLQEAALTGLIGILKSRLPRAISNSPFEVW